MVAIQMVINDILRALCLNDDNRRRADGNGGKTGKTAWRISRKAQARYSSWQLKKQLNGIPEKSKMA